MSWRAGRRFFSTSLILLDAIRRGYAICCRKTKKDRTKAIRKGKYHGAPKARPNKLNVKMNAAKTLREAKDIAM